jgi:squalene-hopene/tetraprenyl-beta-curcumene cyclase
MGLLAAGEARHPAVARGVEFLLQTQTSDGSWYEPEFTGTGFPKYFFIKYHMYQHYFPLMALARYRSSLADV